MRYSRLDQRVGGLGDTAWEIHRRAAERAAAGEPVIVLSVGEDAGAVTHPMVVDAAVSALRDGHHHYAPLTGTLALREAVAEHHQRSTGQVVDAQGCSVLAGAQNALFAVMLALLDHEDEIIVPEPYYATYPGVCQVSGAHMVNVPCDPESGFVVDPNRIEATITARTRAILINSPNNPTGATYPKATLQAIAALCQKNDLWLVSDEVYADFVFDGPHISPAALPGMAERVVTIGSLSKSHRMSGWRVGWAVGPPKLSSILNDLACCMLYGIAPFVQDAALAALDHPATEFEIDRQEMLADYKARRDLVCEGLSNVPGLIVRRPAAGMFAMIDVRPTGLSDFDFAARLLDEEDVGVMTGQAFGPSAVGHLRLGFVADRNTLADAVERITRFCVRLAQNKR